MSGKAKVSCLLLLATAVLLTGCTTNVGTWNWTIGPISNQPYDEINGKMREPIDPDEWQRYQQSLTATNSPDATSPPVSP